MIEAVLSVIHYAFSLLFGVAVSVSFAGMARTRKNLLAIGCFSVAALLVQAISWQLWGLEATSKMYPLIIHLPLAVFIVVHFKRPWLIAAVSVLSAYLCCQAPRWIGDVAGAVFDSELMSHGCYIAAVFLVYYILRKYVAGSVTHLMEKSKRSCLVFGAVPLFYYLFDYGTTIYTDLLYEGAREAVQFMPSLVSVFYFVFVILYYTETQRQTSAQRERDMLAAQLQLAKTEFLTLRQLQECTAAYRHDMRHHFTFLQGLAAEGSVDKIKEYLSAAQQDVDAITPVRFCENETVNLILSSFAAKAKQADVLLTVAVQMPGRLPLSDTELCSLLSNGLENAIAAAAACPDSRCRTVTVKAVVHKSKLLISIENAYTGEIIMRDGLPRSALEGHGYGTRSIMAIAEGHGGQAIFSAGEDIFAMKVMLPLWE